MTEKENKKVNRLPALVGAWMKMVETKTRSVIQVEIHRGTNSRIGRVIEITS